MYISHFRFPKPIPGRYRILFGIILVAILFNPVLALPPSNGGGLSQFNQGVPVYWPYHVGLMIAGFILLLAGAIIAHFHKTKNWYKYHAILQCSGAACIIAGMAVGVYMVSLSGLPHLRNPHEILGAITGILIAITLVLGYSIRRINIGKKTVRTSHRWMGRIALGLMVITMIFGLFILSRLLQH